MGIDVGSLNFILDHKERLKGRTLQLGRQGLHFGGSFGKHQEKLSRFLFENHVPGIPFERVLENADGHTERLFELLGADSIDTMDYSSYERATIVHDLNKPVPLELHNAFDYIFDGGTTEHIYDVKMVNDNIKNMLKEGGTYICVTTCNNFVGHGFYQFSPEFFRSVYSAEAGYKIHSINLIELLENDPFINMHNIPAPVPGNRQDVKTGPNQYYVAACIEKISSPSDETNIQQSDYVKIWSHY